MRAIETTSRAIVETPPEIAWAMLCDYANDLHWRGGLLRMEQDHPGPVFEGAHVIEELVVLGRTVVSEVEVHDVQPGVSFSWRVGDGTAARGSRRLVALGASRCELILEKHLELAGTERLLRPIVALAVRRTERADARRAAAFHRQDGIGIEHHATRATPGGAVRGGRCGQRDRHSGRSASRSLTGHAAREPLRTPEYVRRSVGVSSGPSWRLGDLHGSF